MLNTPAVRRALGPPSITAVIFALTFASPALADGAAAAPREGAAAAAAETSAPAATAASDDASATPDGADSTWTTAQQSEASSVAKETIVEDSIVVTGSRREQRQSELVRTTAVVDRQDLKIELSKSSNVGDTLGRLIPGYGAPTFIDLIRNQTLRGREPQYLFDGVPLVYNGGAAFSESPLVKFEPGVVDQVEVLYGPSSNYGAGATGGVIQMVTRGAAD
ncbi:MAG: TonB-dependent receptor plug domain-containing protein, partial [Acidobacteriota bacterium]